MYIYIPVQNEANLMPQIKFTKLKRFSKKAQNTQSSKFSYNPVQNGGVGERWVDS